jgi:hypothetical protein
VNRGEQVLATDLLFTGDAWAKIDSADYQQILHGIGDRPIGLEGAQLIEVARWIGQRAGLTQVRVESTGIRNQVAALIASALQPELFSEVVVREGMASLSYLLEKPVEFNQAADLFCLDLYKEFDLDRLESMAAPTRFVHGPYLTMVAKGH